jgi:hypothetical protein
VADYDGNGRVDTSDIGTYAAAHRSLAASRAHARAAAAGCAGFALEAVLYLAAGGVDPKAQAFPGGWRVTERSWLGSDGGRRWNIWGPDGKYYQHVLGGDGSSSTGSGSHSGGSFEELDPYDMPPGFPKLPGVRNCHQDEYGDWWDDEGNPVPRPPQAVMGDYMGNPIIMAPVLPALPGPIMWPKIEPIRWLAPAPTG